MGSGEGAETRWWAVRAVRERCGSVAGGGEGTVRPCLGVWVCRGCGWWAVSAVFGG